ncbi:hypothetical protein pEaSNUABM37_00020 [Erwinia phage pEa_SNUABM_37]|nr:hypothetical protein pEaSNUABM37_00020 [Erwinia phage pEa_SNUABM_37]QXO10490.1 hypothetical protein pEaSNUABM48_00020 [Erwinia phage pEa_SNUABM_48]
MNTPSLERYPFDYTGEATTNLVDGELHVIPPGKKNKIFSLLEGAAFSRSIKLRYGDGTYLRPWVDFQPAYLYPEATQAVGDACTGLVMIINESVSGYVYAEYQVVGDRYQHNSKAVEDLLWAAVSDDRPVFWPDILDRPSVFPPAPHTHDIFNETYGWDERVLLVDTWTTEVLETADNERLEGIRAAVQTVEAYLTQRFSQVNQIVDTHINTKHAHAETKAQAGFGSLVNIPTATIDQARNGDRLDLRLTVAGAEAILTDALTAYSANLMKQGILPISRWGNLTYLEPGVSGSFEGSAQISTVDSRMSVLEVDGTLVRLRSGTNGTSVGIYYDYMLNAVTDPLGASMIKTNTQYWPAAMGATYKPYRLFRSTSDVLWGLAYQVSAFPTLNNKYFIALTGSSFDSSKHDVAFVNSTYTHSEYGLRSITDRAHLTIIDGYVYCVDYCPWGNTRKVGFVILRVPVADIKSKTDVTWEFLKGWTATGGIGGTMTGDSINMAAREYSTVASDNPMILGDAPMEATLYRSSWMFYVVSDSPGVLRIAMGGMMHYYTTQRLQVQSIGFRCLVNVNTKTAQWVDSPKQMRVRINNGDLANISLDTTDAAKLNQMQLALAVGQGTQGGDEHGCYFIDYNTGYYMKSYITNILNVSIAWETGRIANWTNKIAAWDIVGRQVVRDRRQVDNPTFGSPVNNSLMQPYGLTGNRMLLRVLNESNNMKLVRASYGTNNNYTYNVTNVGAVKGYEPTADRVDAPEINWNYRAISYLNGSSLSMWGSVLIPYMNSAPTTINAADGTYANTTGVTWDVNELNAAALAFARTLDIGAVVTDARCDIFVPQDASLPILATIWTRHTTTLGATSRIYVTGVNYSGARTGNITGYSLKTSGYFYNDSVVDRASPGSNNNTGQQPGMTVHRVGNDLIITAGSSTQTSVPGGLAAHFACFSYNLTTGAITPTNYKLIDTNPYTGGIGWFPMILPGYGTLLLDRDMAGQTFGTLMGVLPMGNTVADFNSFNAGDKTDRFVIMAQEVKQGWMIYFTEEVPVILNGREGTAPITAIDLTTVKANPANTTFYCYAVETNGVMSYRITATEEAPTINKMYIGTIVTSGNAISNIRLNKRSRIGIYQISDTKSGTSIPVSTGLPFQRGDWSWDS